MLWSAGTCQLPTHVIRKLQLSRLERCLALQIPLPAIAPLDCPPCVPGRIMDLTNLRDSLDERERHPAYTSAKKSELRLTRDFKGVFCVRRGREGEDWIG